MFCLKICLNSRNALFIENFMQKWKIPSQKNSTVTFLLTIFSQNSFFIYPSKMLCKNKKFQFYKYAKRREIRKKNPKKKL